MANKLVLTQAAEVSDPYKELTQLAKEADILIILDLLKTLHHTDGDAEKRDRFSQAIRYIYQSVPQHRHIDFLGIGALLYSKRTDQGLLQKLYAVIASLPLTYAKNPQHRHYSTLGAHHLLTLTTELVQNTRETRPGQTSAALQYLDICAELLVICLSKQQIKPASDPISKSLEFPLLTSFFFSTTQLKDILPKYEAIQKGDGISLPELPLFKIGEWQWLFSKDLLTDTLLRTYVYLSERHV